MPVLIPLTRGASTLVDEIDLPFIERYRWHAGGPDGRFYARRSTTIIKNGVEVKSHRLLHRDLMEMGFGYDVIVDHINGDTLDNRRVNLRICSQSENNANRRRPLGGGTSRFRGVFLRKDCMRWSASITHNNSSRGLGVFDNEEDAARAYDAAAIKLHGDFARLNFPIAMMRNHSSMALSMSGQKLTETSK